MSAGPAKAVIDYELLLSKYIEHVGEEEGVTFISQFLLRDGYYEGMHSDVKLTIEEYAALKRASEARGT